MNLFSGVTILDVTDATVISSERGKPFSMKNRPTFGLSFAKSGRIVYRMNGGETVSEPGIGVIIPMGADYDLIREKTGLFTLVDFTAEGLPTDRFLSFPVAGEEILHSLFDSLFHAVAIEKNRLQAIRFLYEILDRAGTVFKGADAPLTVAERYMHDHLCDPDLDNRRIADAAHISEVYFRTLFREKRGIPPHRYIISARLEIACRMLTGSRKTVGEIARACGFSDVFHFNRTFRERIGMTPGEFRKRTRGI